MNKFKSGLVLLATLILVACGGNNDVPGKPQFTALVSFGDSLSDVGSYNVGVINYYGGGQFTINAASTVKATTPTNWTEFTSLSLNLGMPCAAQTGLDDGTLGSVSSTLGVTYVMPPVDHAGCTGYAQGGSRVTDPVGIGNASSPVQPGIFLTVPVVAQIQNYLTANGGSFSGNEVVTVMAGANDVLAQAGSVGPSYPPASAVAAVQTAASELANDVNTQIVGKGAKYVVVANIPDIASTPYGVSLGANVALIDTLVTAFNAQLKASLPDSANVLNVDAYTASKDEVANSGKYNLTNVTATACNLNYGFNILATSGVADSGSSLVCNAGNLNAGVSPTDHYLFADMVHPTPYGHLLFATYVLQAMTNKGWY
ncbi:MAG TPA: SGNH/GDSL hydrolase family protein [Gallionella sp.]|nr:SGNH/GDSL hydrolase family protein [Gallionella sp.]